MTIEDDTQLKRRTVIQLTCRAPKSVVFLYIELIGPMLFVTNRCNVRVKINHNRQLKEACRFLDRVIVRTFIVITHWESITYFCTQNKLMVTDERQKIIE